MNRPATFLFLTLLGSSVSAADFIVNSQSDVPEASPGNGICNPVNAVGNTCTLRAAIMEANALGGTHNILLASGTYSLTRSGVGEDLADTGDLDIVGTIRIVNGTNNPPVVYGNYADRVFDVHTGGSLTLENIHVTGGEANAAGTTNGGGIRVGDGAELILRQAIVSANIGNIGGGIYSDGSVTIEDSEFFHNVITDDEVLTSFADGTAILSRGELQISRSTFRSNGVIPGGDGLFLENEYAIEVREGFTPNPQTTIFNSTFHANTNGVFSDEVPLAVYQSTFSENGARGIRFLPKVANIDELQFQVVSTVLYGHSSGDCNGPYGPQNAYDVEGRSNASSDTSCSFVGPNDFENIGNPFLDHDLSDNGGLTLTRMPHPTSPLVDPVGFTCVANEDQRGQSRPIDGDESGGMAECDIGAVEYDPMTDPVLPDEMFSDGFE